MKDETNFKYCSLCGRNRIKLNLKQCPDHPKTIWTDKPFKRGVKYLGEENGTFKRLEENVDYFVDEEK